MSKAYDVIMRLCDSRGIKKTALEKELGWGRGSIGKMKNAKNNPSSDRLQVVADYFNVPLSEFTEQPHKMFDLTLHERSDTFNVDVFAGNQGIKITKRIPILGDVAAGVPITSVEHIIGWEEISGEKALSGEYFALKIKGESMESRFKDGDTVIVRQQPDAESEDVVIALIGSGEDCETACKRLRKYPDGSIALLSDNPAYQPLYFSAQEVFERPVTILGKVVELRATI